MVQSLIAVLGIGLRGSLLRLYACGLDLLALASPAHAPGWQRKKERQMRSRPGGLDDGAWGPPAKCFFVAESIAPEGLISPHPAPDLA
jgi:hypothetical protein